MWFKNLLIYRLTRSIDWSKIENSLSEFAFHPCGPQDVKRFGWASPLKGSGLFTHIADGNILIKAQLEEKLLPRPVIKEVAQEKIDKIESEKKSRLSSKEKRAIKDDVVIELIPRAFSRKSYHNAIIFPKLNIIAVDASTFKSAENLLSLLRKSLGSLPVVPILPKKPLSTTMTNWIQEDAAPNGFTIGDSAELKSIRQDGGIVKCAQQDLSSGEIRSHIDNDKLFYKLNINWQDHIDFILCDDFSIKRLHFSDNLKEQNADISNEDFAARFDADFCLLCGELSKLINDLFSKIGVATD